MLSVPASQRTEELTCCLRILYTGIHADSHAYVAVCTHAQIACTCTHYLHILYTGAYTHFSTKTTRKATLPSIKRKAAYKFRIHIYALDRTIIPQKLCTKSSGRDAWLACPSLPGFRCPESPGFWCPECPGIPSACISGLPFGTWPTCDVMCRRLDSLCVNICFMCWHLDSLCVNICFMCWHLDSLCVNICFMCWHLVCVCVFEQVLCFGF
jgi:hypothetical protein